LKVVFDEAGPPGNPIVKPTGGRIGLTRHPVDVGDADLERFRLDCLDQRRTHPFAARVRIGEEILKIAVVRERPAAAMIEVMDEPDGLVVDRSDETFGFELSVAEQAAPRRLEDLVRQAGLVERQIRAPKPLPVGVVGLRKRADDDFRRDILLCDGSHSVREFRPRRSTGGTSRGIAHISVS
jgi:hypothetical protein